MSTSRLEKFIYAICSMDVSDLPVPLSRIEKLWSCLITGETPDFEPLSRNEKYLMAMLDRYDISNLPAPMSRGEKLLYKIAVGETDLSDVPGYLSRYEELLKYLIENGGISGGDFEYILYTLNQSLYTLYTTAEKPVKSAILKGQTLVNLVGEKREYWSGGVPNGLYGWEFLLPCNLTSGKTYLAIFDAVGTIDESNAKVYLMDNGFDSNSGNTTSTVPTFRIGHNVVKCIATNDVHRILRIRTSFTENVAFTVSNVMLIEYQEGMENWDIPYFEGMQSVKMPVLTTTGKNLFDVESVFKVDGNTVKEAKDGSVVLYKPSHNSFILETIKVKANTTYTISCEFEKIIDGGRPVYGLGGVTENKTAISDSNGNLVLFMRPGEQTNESEVKFYNIQLEEGSTATSFESYKTNILTVNEDVELRGMGDVQDTLDLLTGEVTQRIGEVVLDGTQSVVIPTDFGFGTNYPDSNYAVFRVEHGQPNSINEVNLLNTLMSESLKSLTWVEHQKTPQEGISNCHKKHFTISVLKSRLEEDSISGIKKWLQSNPITVQYRLETESIKTVDLSVVDQDGQPTQLGTFENVTHVSLEAENLIPEVEMEVATNLLEDTVFNLTNAFNTLYPTSEKPVKSAILKGQTLVNIVNNDNWVRGTDDENSLFTQNISIKKGQTYTVIGKIDISDAFHESELATAFRIRTGTNNSGISLLFIEQSNAVIKQTFTNNENDTIHIRFFNQKTNYKKLMIIEGDHTQEDIPYFEGMQSVKMPVLTTTGKNLIIKPQYGYVANGVINTGVKAWINSDYIYVKGLKEIICSTSNVLNGSTNIATYNKNKQLIRALNGRDKATLNDDEYYVIFSRRKLDNSEITQEELLNSRMQLEEGSTATPYEPYKSNILTVNEDIELRGIGEVKDTLDCLTGEVTERIAEIVLDGSEDWLSHAETTNTRVFKLIIDNLKKINHHIISDRFTANASGDVEKITNSGNVVYVAILKSKVDNLKNFKSYLSQNPITAQYQLATESIKTVDLSIVNQDGNETNLETFDDTTHVLLQSEAGPNPGAALTVRTKIPSASSTSLLMDDISTEQQQLETTVDEQSNNVDATMIATTEIFEETL